MRSQAIASVSRTAAAVRHDLGRLGAHPPREAARIALGRLSSQAVGIVREAQLRRQPAIVSAVDVERTLAPGAATVARRGLVALAVVAVFARELECAPEPRRRQLLARAQALVDHRFGLLGAGPVQLGNPIDWACDFKTGARWPTRHPTRLRTVLPNDSDILVPWVLSWFQHLPVLAAAYRVSGEPRYLDELRSQVSDWIARNPVGLGIHWMSPMNAAMRAISWVASLALVSDAVTDEAWLRSVVGSLIGHGRFIAAHVGDEPPNNHQLACVVALLALSVVLEGAADASAWRASGAAALEDGVDVWTRRDGCAGEGSIAYHAFVAELLFCAADAARAAGASPSESFLARLERMADFTAHYTQPSGRAPQIGDGGHWRLLPLDDYGQRPSGHLGLLRRYGFPAERSTCSATFPDGGFHVLQRGNTHLVVRCGAASGDAAHMHHDQLSFELAVGGQAMIVDPGTYVYWTASSEERNRFRSTRFHSALRIGHLPEFEFDPLDAERMGLARRSKVTRWEPDGDFAVLEGQYHGFELLRPPALHLRTFALDGAGRALTIRDRVLSRAAHDLLWTFPLAPCRVTLGDGHMRAQFSDGALTIRAHGAELRVEDGWYSPDYGIRERVPFLRAARRSTPGCDDVVFVLAVER